MAELEDRDLAEAADKANAIFGSLSQELDRCASERVAAVDVLEMAQRYFGKEFDAGVLKELELPTLIPVHHCLPWHYWFPWKPIWCWWWHHHYPKHHCYPWWWHRCHLHY